MHPTAEALLQAHVAYLLAEMETDRLEPRFAQGIARFLERAADISLGEAVTPAQIKQTAHRYAIEMQLGGALPELVGDVARRIYRHKAMDKTRLHELVPDAHFEEFLDKTLELEKVYQALVIESVSNPIYSEVISDLLYAGIRDFVTRLRFPGSKSAARVGKALSRRARPELGEEVEEKLRSFIQKGTHARLKASQKQFLQAVESEHFREVLLDLWDDNKERAVADFRNYLGKRDVEEFFVIGYEYFQHLRGTRLFREMIDAGIDTFFAKYGETSLRDLLEEIGVTPEMMLAEALQFAPPVIDMLRRRGLLEEIVREGLEGFYASEAVTGILGG